jgi:hypothetical protein
MRGTTWCARPRPSISEASPDDLEKAIRETEEDWEKQASRVRGVGYQAQRRNAYGHGVGPKFSDLTLDGLDGQLRAAEARQ